MEAGCEIPNWIKLTETLLEMGRDEVGVCTSRYFATAHEILFVVLNMVMSSHFFLHSSSSSAHIGVAVGNDGYSLDARRCQLWQGHLTKESLSLLHWHTSKQAPGPKDPEKQEAAFVQGLICQLMKYPCSSLDLGLPVRGVR